MRGHDGAVRFFVTQTEAFDALRLEPQDFLEIPDRLVVTLRISGHARHSGIDVKFERTHVFTYRGDKVLRMEVYADRTEAFEAARAEIRPNHR
jgi:ketosteroid isomerase-like protein